MPTVTLVNPRGTQQVVTELGALEHYVRRGFTPQDGSSIAAARQTFTGQPATPLGLEARDLFNVRDYGAKGDGTTDDTAAFNNASAAANAAGGGTVYVPAGVYRASIKLYTYVSLAGSGRRSHIKLPDAANTHVVSLANTGAAQTTISNLTIDGNKTAQTGTWHGIHLGNAGSVYAPGLKTPRHTVRDVFIWNCSGDGLNHSGGNFGGDCTFTGINVYHCARYGAYTSSPDSQWSSIDIGQSGSHGFYIDGATNNRITNAKVWFSGAVDKTNCDGFYIDGSRNQLAACEAQDNGRHGFNLTAAAGNNTLQACTADSNSQYNPGVGGGFLVAGPLNLITGVSFDRGNEPTSPQAYGLIMSGGARNVIDLIVGTIGTAAISGSVGTNNNVRVNPLTGGVTNVNRGQFTVTDAAGQNRSMNFWTGGSARWVMRANGTAEGGSNAGSDLEIACSTDAGGGLYTPLVITRATGVAKNQRGTARNWLAQTLAANGAVTIDAAAGDIQQITLGANATGATISNPTTGQRLSIAWLQDATGGRTYVWPAACKFAGGAAPAASTIGGYRDRVMFEYDGTFWFEISRSAAAH